VSCNLKAHLNCCLVTSGGGEHAERPTMPCCYVHITLLLLPSIAAISELYQRVESLSAGTECR